MNCEAQIWSIKMFVILKHRKKVKLNPIITESPGSPVSLRSLCHGFENVCRVEWVLVCKSCFAWEWNWGMRVELCVDSSGRVKTLTGGAFVLLTSLAWLTKKKFHWIMSTAESILIAFASTHQFLFQDDISQQLIPMLLKLINYREIPVPF